ncbi:MAG: 6-phosphogluconolactonase, partial [Bacteroidales bacterium]|nr:6-phosphogluconolactonase [Bacteroidales bacterium]
MKHFALPKDGGLITSGLPDDVLHSHEEIRTEIFSEPSAASEAVSEIVIKAIKDFETANPGKLFRLGLTTGATPVSLYNKLSRKYTEGRVSFRNVEIFSIDEYYPIDSTSMQSRNYRLHTLLIDKIDIKPENVHLPDGSVPQESLKEFCEQYDKFTSNIDLLVVGIGENGQVGFHVSVTSSRRRPRVVILPYK